MAGGVSFRKALGGAPSKPRLDGGQRYFAAYRRSIWNPGPTPEAGRQLYTATWDQIRWVVFAGLAFAAAGALTLILAKTPALELTARALCGIGLAPIYPLAVAQPDRTILEDHQASCSRPESRRRGGTAGNRLPRKSAGVCEPDWRSHCRRLQLRRGCRVAFRNDRARIAAR